MLGHVLRRLLWAVPALVGISLVTFLFLSYVPDPTDDPDFAASLAPSDLDRLRRERHLDLPRFLNLAPRDVRDRAAAALAAAVSGGPDEAAGQAELARLGGAALPYVLPKLDALPPDRRVTLALALSPIAHRMGLGRSEPDDPERAVAFWTRFWGDRGIEFRRAVVRSAVARLARYGAGARAKELYELDTFVLDDVLAALEPPEDEAGVARARALVEVAAHVTGRDDRIGPDDGLDAARAAVDRWQQWWAVYRSDFVADAGLGRVADTVIETRYGKWAYDAVTHRFGYGVAPLPPAGAPAPGVPQPGPRVLDELAARVPVTLGIVLGAIGLAYAMAVPIGVGLAVYRRRRTDVVLTILALVVYAIPTAAIAVAVRHFLGGGVLAATAVLAAALAAAPAAQQGAALSAALSQDYVRAAAARGASPRRALLVHALRNALLPVATLATLEGPMALGGAFVVERVFSLRGVGEATILAVQRRDIAWLMAISMVAAVIAAATVVLADLASVALDPRLGPAVLARKGRE
jgi:ABC-type dipeptide/oligopeptide/nickel transport system permease component